MTLNSDMTQERFIRGLKRDTFCRLKPSQLHGVGVFAIRPIPAGINPFMESRRSTFMEIPSPFIREDPYIPESVKQLVIDMCPEVNGVFYVPDHSMNELGIAFYLNYSKSPNMIAINGGEDFVTLRPIQEDEELTVDYEAYSAINMEPGEIK